MRIADLNWTQMEGLLKSEDRAVLPLGSTEQHAYLSLATDDILAERVAAEAAEPLGVPVYPVLNYGLTPDFMAYPGTVTLTRSVFVSVVTEILYGIASHGSRRIVIVNGHGGNRAAKEDVLQWAHGQKLQLKWHDWWAAPRFLDKVRSIDANASHASWLENFPWTRLDHVRMPRDAKPMIDYEHYKTLEPSGVRAYLGDGSFGGAYQRSEDDAHAIWRAGVEETRSIIASGWQD